MSETHKPPLGLYRVFWKSGGSSLAAIGMLPNGDRWLAPTNWIRPSEKQDVWDDIKKLEPIDSQERYPPPIQDKDLDTVLEWYRLNLPDAYSMMHQFASNGEAANMLIRACQAGKETRRHLLEICRSDFCLALKHPDIDIYRNRAEHCVDWITRELNDAEAFATLKERWAQQEKEYEREEQGTDEQDANQGPDGR